MVPKGHPGTLQTESVKPKDASCRLYLRCLNDCTRKWPGCKEKLAAFWKTYSF